jgi:tetratricopeptide (TPR) repeat protein
MGGHRKMTDPIVQKTDAGKAFSHAGFAAPASALVLWLLRFIPLFFPGVRLWGINHLLFLPFGFAVDYAIAGIVLLLAFIPPISCRLEPWFASRGDFLFGTSMHLRWAVAGVILLPAFWFLRMPTNLLGDGYTVINNIAGDMPVIFKWSETGAVRAIYAVSKLIPVEGLARGEYAFALVSVLSGAATLFFFFGIAFELSTDSAMRLFTVCLLVFSGWSLLFFGYAENYPILWPFISAYIYFSIRYLQGKGPLIVPLIILAAALVLHLQTIFFLASAMVIFLGRGRSRRFYGRHRKLVWSVFAGIAVVAAAAFVREYQQSLPFRIHFLPPFVGRTATPKAAIFSPTHLLDMVNELLLVAPLLPVLILLAWKGRRSLMNTPVGVFLLVFSSGGLLLLLILDPRLGLGRDWDLFAISGLGVTLAGIWSIAAAEYIGRRLYPGLALLALVLVLPYFATNLSAKPSVAYMKWLLDLDAGKSKSGMVMLRDYYKDRGDTTTADSINYAIKKRHPSANLDGAAMNLISLGQYDKALALADSMFALDPESKESFNLRGNVYLKMGRYREALDDLSMAHRLGPYDYRTMVRIAAVYYWQNRIDSAMKYLRRAQRYGPRAPSLIESMAVAFLAQRQYDSAFVYGRQSQQVDSTSPVGYYVVGIYYYLRGDSAQARRNLTHCVQISNPGPNRDQAISILKELDSLSARQ